MTIMQAIDERVDEIKNQYKSKQVLKLTEKEYEILKRALICSNARSCAVVIAYRGIPVKVKKENK